MTEILEEFTDCVKSRIKAGVTQVNGCLCVEAQKMKRQRFDNGESAESHVSSAAMTVGQV